tara:strand:- start:1620 stop:2687 length:1068 start_codon:yes stop_codon:yes gene_type:complete
MANDENTTDKSFLKDFLIPDKEDWEFLKDAGRFWGGAPTEMSGVVKNFLDRGQGSLLPGIYNFYQSTFRKGKEGEITVPWDQIQNDEKLLMELDNMQEVHLRNNKDEIKNRSDEWNDHFYDMLDKYNIDISDDPADMAQKLNSAMMFENKEEGSKDNQKLFDLQDNYNMSTSPYIVNDENQDQIPESVTFRHDLFSNTPGEPDVKLINENSISFPYLGDYTFNDEGNFEMKYPSVYKPLDQPGVENYLDKVPAGDALQKWQEFVTPEYSPEPELFRKPGWSLAGMAPAMLRGVGPTAWKAAKWAAPKVAPFAAKATGLASLLHSGNVEAPTIVPEGVEATPENLEKYGKILMGNQ